VAGRHKRVSADRGCLRHMSMGWQFRDRHRVRLLAALFTERMPASDMDWGAGAKVRQGEVHATVATERRSEQREQRLILTDRQKLAIAKRPAFWCEDETHDPDLG